MIPRPQAVGVELTLGGFLSSILLLEWLGPHMDPPAKVALAQVLHVLTALAFGVVGLVLAAWPRCRMPWFALLVAGVLGPLLGAASAWGLDRFHPLEGVSADLAVPHGALIGAALAPFVALTWIRMQPHDETRFERVACHRAAWSVMLLLLAAGQLVVAGSREMLVYREQLQARTDVACAIGVLAAFALVGVCAADARQSRALRLALETDGLVEGEAVDEHAYGRVRASARGNLALLLAGVLCLAAAHQVGGPSYALWWPSDVTDW